MAAAGRASVVSETRAFGAASPLKRYRPHLLAALLLCPLLLPGLHGRLRDALLDLRFLLLQRAATGTVALVEIDPRSIDKIGVWPWPRTVHAELIERLERAGVAEIAFDVDFSSPSSPAADAAFAGALRSAGGSVVLAAFRQRVPDRGNGHTLHVNRPIPAFADAAWLGLVNVAPEADGVIRAYGYGDEIEGEVYPSLAALLAGAHDRGGKPFRIDFGIRPDTVPRVSVIDVLQGVPEAIAALRGKKVIVGGTAAELGDHFNVPNGQIVPGSMIQALAAESLVQGRALTLGSPSLALGMAGALLLAMVALWGRTRPATRVAGVLGFAVAGEAAALVLQSGTPIILDTSALWGACMAYLVAIGFDELKLRDVLRSAAERRFQRIAMSLGDGLVCADSGGRITFSNPAAAAIFGYGEAELSGRPFEDLLPETPVSGSEAFSLRDLPLDRLQNSAGMVIELTGRKRSGERFDLECNLSAWRTAEVVHYGAVLRDISQRKRQQERISYLAEYDTLTGLLNGNSLIARLEAAMENSGDAGPAGVLMLVAVGRFQQISDLHGHSFGTRVLAAVANRLRALVSAPNILARLSGDEFAVVWFDTDGPEAARLGARIASVFEDEPVEVGEQRHRVAMSIGTALMAEAGSSEELLGNAHFALAEAKLASSGAVVAFEARMRQVLTKRDSLEGELRAALVRDEFELFYQPQVELGTGRLIGAEALIRWRHPERGYVSPGDFMPVVNTSSVSDGVAGWVLETACRQAACWQGRGNPIRIGVNLSQSQFTGGDLGAQLAQLLHDTKLSPSLLELEVTEDIILDHIDRTQRMLATIRGLGVSIAFDDFGTGYGSLTYLRTFPLDRIKIDRSFVSGMIAGTADAAIVRSTIDLSKALGLAVIAEGIEDGEIAAALESMGCREGQGYLFGRPMPAADFEAKWFTPEAASAKAA